MKAEFNICTYEPEGAGCGYGWWIEASFWERSIRVNSCQVLASFLANSQSWFHMASSPIFPSWCWQMPGLMLGNCGKGATLWLMPKTLSLQVKLSENFVSPSCCFYLPSQTSTYGHMIFKFFVVLCDFVFFFFFTSRCVWCSSWNVSCLWNGPVQTPYSLHYTYIKHLLYTLSGYSQRRACKWMWSPLVSAVCRDPYSHQILTSAIHLKISCILGALGWLG